MAERVGAKKKKRNEEEERVQPFLEVFSLSFLLEGEGRRKKM
jgi:hypothetical protein